MIEPKALTEARQRLSRAEADLFGKDAVLHYQEGLALLSELADEGAPELAILADNIANAYAAKLYAAIRTLLARDRNVPEPRLEHLLRLVLVFDEADAELPGDARDIKLALGRTLLERHLEGHAAQEKRAALEQLMRIAARSND
jgi:hypothetical protein